MASVLCMPSIAALDAQINFLTAAPPVSSVNGRYLGRGNSYGAHSKSNRGSVDHLGLYRARNCTTPALSCTNHWSRCRLTERDSRPTGLRNARQRLLYSGKLGSIYGLPERSRRRVFPRGVSEDTDEENVSTGLGFRDGFAREGWGFSDESVGGTGRGTRSTAKVAVKGSEKRKGKGRGKSGSQNDAPSRKGADIQFMEVEEEDEGLDLPAIDEILAGLDLEPRPLQARFEGEDEEGEEGERVQEGEGAEEVENFDHEGHQRNKIKAQGEWGNEDEEEEDEDDMASSEEECEDENLYAYGSLEEHWGRVSSDNDEEKERYEETEDLDEVEDLQSGEAYPGFETLEDGSKTESNVEVRQRSGSRLERKLLLQEEQEEGFRMVDRVFELRSRVQAELAAGKESTVRPRDIARLFDFSVDKFQRLAIEAFLRGASVVVCAPTSSGKTLIAEAAAAAVLARGKRLFYTTPLKALSNQKLREFRVKFGEENVGLLTGDAAVNREAPIVVMTTEILRNMLYSSVGEGDEESRLAGVEAVVLDEVHYLSDISRGTVWEETVIYCPREIQLICLSATVANPEELADWIAQVHGPTELITSQRRPVPLMWHFSTRRALLPLLNEQGTEINWRLLPNAQKDDLGDEHPWEEWGISRRKLGRRGFRSEPEAGSSSSSNGNGNGNGAGRRKKGRRGGGADDWTSPEELQLLRRRQVPRIVDTLTQLRERDMLPAIWFIFSRRGCDAAVDVVSDASLLSAADEAEVRSAARAFQAQFPEAVREGALEPLYRGLAAHHAGCLPAWKSFVEELYQRGLVKVVFATETLAAGINMPARTTVLSSLSKRGDHGHALLSANAMLQMAGRAGRRGQDLQGHVVVVQTPFEGAQEACQLLFAGPDPLVSQFTATYGMALNLLAGTRQQPPPDADATAPGAEADKDVPGGERVEKALLGRTMEEARSLVERSFGNYLGNEVVLEARAELGRLEGAIGRLREEKEREAALGVESRIDPTVWQRYEEEKNLLRLEKQIMRLVRERAGALRRSAVEPLLARLANESAPIVRIAYQDRRTGDERQLPALYVERIPRPFFVTEEDKDGEDYDDDLPLYGDRSSSPTSSPSSTEEFPSEPSSPTREKTKASSAPAEAPPPPGTLEASYYVALGADNCWYVFTAAAVRSIHKWPTIRVVERGVEQGGNGSRGGGGGPGMEEGPFRLEENGGGAWREVREEPDGRGGEGGASGQGGGTGDGAGSGEGGRGDATRREAAGGGIREGVRFGSRAWMSVGRAGGTGGATGGVWCAEGSMDTWPWSSQLPVPGGLAGGELQESDELLALERQLAEQRKLVTLIRKRLKATAGYREHRQLLQLQKRREEKIGRLQAKAGRLQERLSKIQPTGWTEFVQVVNVLRRTGAVDAKLHALLPLGQTAAAVRGVNELWLALAFADPALGSLKPSQLAAVCAALVSEGIKARTDSRSRGGGGGGGIYEASDAVYGWCESVDPLRAQLQEMQYVENVQIPCLLDPSMAGLVEAWAAGVGWKELLGDCGLDEGDVARLLRRTIDVLAQIPHLPNIDISTRKLARQAAQVMDRPPISELIG